MMSELMAVPPKRTSKLLADRLSVSIASLKLTMKSRLDRLVRPLLCTVVPRSTAEMAGAVLSIR